MLDIVLHVAVLGSPWLLSQQDADTPARESRTSQVVAGSKDERAAQAADYYGRGRYVEAALEFEGLRRDFPDDPKFLFNAGAARYISGHYAHAVAYLTEYVARTDLSNEDRVEAQAQLDEALNRVRNLAVSVSVPGDASEITVIAQHVARGASDLRPDLVYPTPVRGGTATVMIPLEPGNWVLRAQADGFTEAEQRVEVTRGSDQRAALALQVVPKTETPTTPATQSPVDVPARVSRPLTIGFAAVGGAGIVAGAALIAVGTSKTNGLEDCNIAERKTLGCRQDLAQSLTLRDAGAASLGAGVGLLAGGLTWLIRDGKRRRIAFIAETAVGGLALAGGFAGLSLSSKKFSEANTTSTSNWATHYPAHSTSAGRAASGAAFGFGIGMVASAITGLIVHHKYSSKGRNARNSLQMQGALGPGQAGLMVSGRF